MAYNIRVLSGAIGLLQYKSSSGDTDLASLLVSFFSFVSSRYRVAVVAILKVDQQIELKLVGNLSAYHTDKVEKDFSWIFVFLHFVFFA